MLSRCFLDFSVDAGAFVIGLSQISSFFAAMRCVIKLFGGVFVLSLCPFDNSVCIRAIVIGLR